MKDPFPIAPIPALSKAIQPWAEYLSMPTLPLHIHQVLLAAFFYQFIYAVVAPKLSSRLFPVRYNALSKTKRLSWDVHVVSFTQSTMINFLALWVMYADEERRNMDWQERIYGYTGGAAMIQGLAAGYFLWDLIVTALHPSVFGLGMLAHGISALLVYSFGFRPFLNYYSTNFILWELSTTFLNIHWFFDKLGMTGSKWQLYNGIVLIFTFFSCRLVWGTYQSALVYRDVWKALHNEHAYGPSTSDVAHNISIPSRYESTMQFVSESSAIPLWLAVIYLGANLILNSLNVYWFFKMIQAVQKRFDPKLKEGDQLDDKPSPDEGATTGTDAKSKIKVRPRRGSLLDGEDDDQLPPGI